MASISSCKPRPGRWLHPSTIRSLTAAAPSSRGRRQQGRSNRLVVDRQGTTPNLVVVLQNARPTWPWCGAHAYSERHQPEQLRVNGVAPENQYGMSRHLLAMVGLLFVGGTCQELQSAQGTLDGPFCNFGDMAFQPTSTSSSLTSNSQGRRRLVIIWRGSARRLQGKRADRLQCRGVLPDPRMRVSRYRPQGWRSATSTATVSPTRHRRQPRRPREVLRTRRRRPAEVWRSPRRPADALPERADRNRLDRERQRGAGRVRLSASLDGGATFNPMAGCTGLPAEARTCTWSPTGPPAGVRLRVTARDKAGN